MNEKINEWKAKSFWYIKDEKSGEQVKGLLNIIIQTFVNNESDYFQFYLVCWGDHLTAINTLIIMSSTSDRNIVRTTLNKTASFIPENIHPVQRPCHTEPALNIDWRFLLGDMVRLARQKVNLCYGGKMLVLFLLQFLYEQLSIRYYTDYPQTLSHTIFICSVYINTIPCHFIWFTELWNENWMVWSRSQGSQSWLDCRCFVASTR